MVSAISKGTISTAITAKDHLMQLQSTDALATTQTTPKAFASTKTQTKATTPHQGYQEQKKLTFVTTAFASSSTTTTTTTASSSGPLASSNLRASRCSFLPRSLLRGSPIVIGRIIINRVHQEEVPHPTPHHHDGRRGMGKMMGKKLNGENKSQFVDSRLEQRGKNNDFWGTQKISGILKHLWNWVWIQQQ